MEAQLEKMIEALNALPVYSRTESVEKRVYTVDEIQDILGISISTAYTLIKKNVFHSIKVGRHIRISKTSFDAWLDGQKEEESKNGDTASTT